MNIRDLEYVVAVSSLRSFSQAADKCCVSQPTLSGQIKKLEEELGVQIFERTNKRVMLTETGERIILSAQRILREVEAINDIAVNAHDTTAGKFRLGAFPTLSTYIFPSLVTKVKESLPKLRLILVEEKTSALIDKLHSGELDAALLALPVRDEHFDSAELFVDRFHLATADDHPLAAQQRVTQPMLANYKLLLLEEGHCMRNQALDVCKTYGIPEEQDFRATGLETLRQMVKAGSGITLIPEIAVNTEDSGIKYIPFAEPAPYRTIGLVWRKTTARKAVIDVLRDRILSQPAV